MRDYILADCLRVDELIISLTSTGSRELPLFPSAPSAGIKRDSVSETSHWPTGPACETDRVSGGINGVAVEDALTVVDGAGFIFLEAV